jgi:T5orf172 domain
LRFASFEVLSMRGYLYILSNSAMPNLFKIGFTTRTIKERIQELPSTGVPGVFEVDFC